MVKEMEKEKNLMNYLVKYYSKENIMREKENKCKVNIIENINLKYYLIYKKII